MTVPVPQFDPNRGVPIQGAPIPLGNPAAPGGYASPTGVYPPLSGAPIPQSVPQYGQYAPTYPQYGQPVGAYPPPPPAYVETAPKPGIVPLRPLRFSEILEGMFAAIRHNPAVMLGLPLLILLIATIVGQILGHLFINPLTRVFNDLAHLGFDATYYGQTLGTAFATGFGTGLAMLFALPILEGILTVGVSQSVLGYRVSPHEVWARVRPRIPELIGWTFLHAIIMFAAALLPIVAIIAIAGAIGTVNPGLAIIVSMLLGITTIALVVWLSIRLMLVAPAIALEGLPLGRAMDRGWGLSRGHFWRLAGIYWLVTILASLLASILTIPFSLISGLLSATGPVTAAPGAMAGLLGSLIAAAITAILSASVVAMLYLDLQVRRGGAGALEGYRSANYPAVV